MAEQPVLPSGDDRSQRAAPPDRRRRPGGLRDPSRYESGGADGLRRFRPSLRRDEHHRRDGLCLLVVGNVEPRRFSRGGSGCAATTRSVACARDQMRVAGAHRADARRGLSRPRCGRARAERPHLARCRRAHQRGHLVLGFARLHEDHRHGAARRDHSAAQRLRRGRDRRRSQRRRRSVEAHRRRRAGNLSAPTMPRTRAAARCAPRRA